MADRNSEWESENQENVSGEPCRANVGRGWRDMWVHFGVGRLKMLCLEKGISVHNVSAL